MILAYLAEELDFHKYAASDWLTASLAPIRSSRLDMDDTRDSK